MDHIRAGLFFRRGRRKIRKEFKKSASKLGVSSAQVDMLLMKRDAEDFFEEGDFFEGIADKAELLDNDRTAEDLETGFFLMTDDEKFNFLLDKGPDYIELIQDYVSDLMEQRRF